MADCDARASWRPGVAVVMTGPGISNVTNPIGEAYTESSPALELIGGSNTTPRRAPLSHSRRGMRLGDRGLPAPRRSGPATALQA